MNTDPELRQRLERLQELCMELISAWDEEPTAGHFIDAITISPDLDNPDRCLLGRIETELLQAIPTATPTDA